MNSNAKNEKTFLSGPAFREALPSAYPEKSRGSSPQPSYSFKENHAEKTSYSASTQAPHYPKSSISDRAPSGQALSRLMPPYNQTRPAESSSSSSSAYPTPAPAPVQSFRGYVYEPAPPGWDGGYGGATDVPRTKPIDIPHPERRAAPVYSYISSSGGSSGTSYTGSSSRTPESSYTNYGSASDTSRSVASSFTSYTAGSSNPNSLGGSSTTSWPGGFSL